MSLSDFAKLDTGDAQWTPMAVESNGIANLGQMGPRDEGINVVLARTVLHAEAAPAGKCCILATATRSGYLSMDVRYTKATISIKAATIAIWAQ